MSDLKRIWEEQTRALAKDHGVQPEIKDGADGGVSFLLNGSEVCSITPRSTYYYVSYLDEDDGSFVIKSQTYHGASLEEAVKFNLPLVLGTITSNIQKLKILRVL